ncbi:MAG TPA: hypothetical protein PK959_06590 [Candidatus Competibacteraceae bacterium]|nr:hypothetical protein [Candidatus Competibacteraceae bacterium]
MAAYTPPVGVVNLSLRGTYTPPVGVANLILGADANNNRALTGAATTIVPAANGQLLKIRLLTGAAVTTAPAANGILGKATVLTGAALTLAPTAQGQIRQVRQLTGVATTATPTLTGSASYDVNLLSAYTAATKSNWQDGIRLSLEPATLWQPALHQDASGIGRWQDAQPGYAGNTIHWTAALLQNATPSSTWTDATLQLETCCAAWQQAERVLQQTRTRWQDGPTLETSYRSDFQVQLPLLSPAWRGVWQDGQLEVRGWQDRFHDGTTTIHVEIEVWQQGGYPGNALRPGPPLPPPPLPTAWGTSLRIICPLPGTTLRIGRTACILIAEREIPQQRTYMTTNSAALVRWPDLTPLPCTAITVETDFESWCWSLSATLAGSEAWSLVQPDPLACQVQATINGQTWRFLLDVPSTQRSFNSDRVSLKGRSRAAWLQNPYASRQDFSEANAREMQQLAEAALENTGWSVDWQLENWVVPAGLWTQYSTPIEALIRLATASADGIYTHPTEQIITLHKRWPVAAWLLDGATTDLLIPEDAVISLNQTPVYTQPLNGVYVSGTTAGALALIKIAGTDGALQPTEPITEALLCDTAGVAARQRGLNALSDSGAGWEMDAEVLFTPAIGLVQPGMIVSIAGVKGVSRSCRISAQWSDNSLQVRQIVGLERREVEA